MASVLITGENSFIGKSFVKYSVNSNITLVSVRTRDFTIIDRSDADVVLHLAAIVHTNAREEEYYRVNRDLSLEVARHAKAAGVKQFIFMSTSKVYGRFEEGSSPLTEESPCIPVDDYGISKFEAEEGLRKLADDSFCVSIIRIPVVYGSGMRANMLKFQNLVRNSPLLPFGGSSGRRNYIYIENLTGFIDRIIELRAPGTFIAMDSDPVTIEELSRYFAAAMHRKIRLITPPSIILRLLKCFSPSTHERLFGSFIMDNSRTRKKLDYNPRFTTRDGIERMMCSHE